MAGRRATSIDDRIENQQNKVIRAKAAYEAEVEKLEKLFEKRDAIRKEKFLEAYMKTSRSDAEIMAFLSSGKQEEDTRETESKTIKKRPGRPKKAH